MRCKAGYPNNQAVPVSAIALVGNVGLAMSTFEANNGGKPDLYLLKLTLVGGVDVECVLNIRDIAGDWCIAGDTGNLGLIAGQKLATGKTYAFPVSGLAAAKEVAITTQNNNGGVAVAAAITPVVDAYQG